MFGSHVLTSQSSSPQISHKSRQCLRIPAGLKIPYPQAPPVVDSRYPAPGGLIFGPVLFVFFALHFQNKGFTAPETDQIIRFEMMLDALILVGNQQEGPVVSHVAENVVSLLFQIERGGLFPGTVQDDGIHVGAPGAVDVPFCREVHVRRRADGLVPVQDRQ